MKTWFLGLSQRERRMVQFAIAVLVIFLIYLIVLEPISREHQNNKRNVATATETLEWMKSTSSEIIKLRGGKVPGKARTKKFVLGVVDRSVRKSGLTESMKRIQPEGDSSVRVWFENTEFDNFIQWLATMESKHDLLVNEINIEKTDSSGLVNVRVLFDLL